MLSLNLSTFLLATVVATSAGFIGYAPDGTDDYGNIRVVPVVIINDNDAGRWTDHPLPHLRLRRQVHGSISTDSSGGSNVNLFTPLKQTDSGTLGAVGSVAGLKNGGGYNSASGGLAYHSDAGHSASVLGTHIPDFGNQLTAAGRLNVLATDHHKVGASAFGSRTFPNSPTLPNFNTYGGGVDYLYKDRIGASLSAAHTPLFQKTDVSAMGNLNLFKDRSSSLDLNAGVHRSWSPYMPARSWQPTVGIGYIRSW